MEIPPITFFRTRRIKFIAFLSFAFIIGFASFYTHSYSIPAFDYSWETPLSYLLGPILGCLCALAVNSQAPCMETLAVAPIGLFRALTLLSLCLYQILLIVLIRFIANTFILEVPITHKQFITLIFATLAFQGIGMISGALFASHKILLMPAIAIFMCIGFGFNTDTSPRPFHILVTHSPASLIISVLLWVSGLLALKFLKLNACENLYK